MVVIVLDITWDGVAIARGRGKIDDTGQLLLLAHTVATEYSENGQKETLSLKISPCLRNTRPGLAASLSLA